MNIGPIIPGLLCAWIATAWTLSQHARQYEGHMVYDIITGNDQHKDLLSKLITHHQLDVWRFPKSYDDTMTIRIHPKYIKTVLETLNRHGLHYSIKHRSVQNLVDEEMASMQQARQKRASSFDRYNYNSHSAINDFLETLADQCTKCSVQNIGTSTEGRAMKVLTISSGSNKPAVFIDGGIHAREWISPATVINIMYRLATDQSVSDLVNSFDWHFLPVANPDGYAYSRTHDRMWRKTRSRQTNGILNQHSPCIGADPNRNFGYEWGRTGASSDPCDETYKGTAAFSEPETQNMRNFISAHRQHIKAYITFHSYGQDFVYPWGFHGCVAGSPTDEADLRDVAIASTHAMQHAHGGLHSHYNIGSSGCSIYPAAGGSDDWAKGGAGIKYSYTIELPDTGRYGFILPANKIDPVSAETFEGMKALVSRLKEKEGL